MPIYTLYKIYIKFKFGVSPITRSEAQRDDVADYSLRAICNAHIHTYVYIHVYHQPRRPMPNFLLNNWKVSRRDKEAGFNLPEICERVDRHRRRHRLGLGLSLGESLHVFCPRTERIHIFIDVVVAAIYTYIHNTSLYLQP